MKASMNYGSKLIWVPTAYILINNSSCCDKQNHNISTSSDFKLDQSQPRKYTREEVEKSVKKLVSFKNNVYDITDYIPIHPGGDEIHRALNGPLDKYFKLFPHHFNNNVQDILKQYKVGELLLKPNERKPNIPEYENDPNKFKFEFVIDFTDEQDLPTITGTVDNVDKNKNRLNGNLLLKKTISINELKADFQARILSIDVACGLGSWFGKWEEEFIEKGGSKIYKGVWLGDVIIRLLNGKLNQKGVQSSTLEDNMKRCGLNHPFLLLDKNNNCNSHNFEDVDLNQLYVHYHCYDDYIDTIPLDKCLTNNNNNSPHTIKQFINNHHGKAYDTSSFFMDILKKSLLVYEVNGITLTSDQPLPGGGPLMAITPGTHCKYSCDAKWITKIVINKQNSMQGVRYGGKYDP